MDEISIPWPEKDDDPFKEGVYGPTQANLDWLDYWSTSFTKDLIIAEAFKETADKTVDNLETANRREHPDKFFFPVAYLYRHAFELGLKSILRYGIELLIIKEDDIVKEMLCAHNLHKLWNKTRCVLEEFYSGDDKNVLTNVEKVILQFHKLDSSGQAFRYVRDVKGKPHLENVPKLVDLVNLKNVVSNVYSFLDCCNDGLSDATDYQNQNDY